MSTPTRFPLQWPVGWKRTPAADVRAGRFSKSVTRHASHGSYKARGELTIAEAARRLQAELELMAVDPDSIILSSNLRLNLDGSVRSAQAQPTDVGVCVYWEDAGRKRCMAIDLYDRVEHNIAALAATVDAMRSIERHGGASILDRAFTGFAALPAPIVMGGQRPWREVLECGAGPAREEEISANYRKLTKTAHPDRAGGSQSKMAELNAARAEAMNEVDRGRALLPRRPADDAR